MNHGRDRKRRSPLLSPATKHFAPKQRALEFTALLKAYNLSPARFLFSEFVRNKYFISKRAQELLVSRNVYAERHLRLAVCTLKSLSREINYAPPKKKEANP